MANLSLQHIYKRYPGGVEAVKDFCLEIKDKEFIILVGPSGCGKSTTLRMIAGLEEISEGELYIGDKLVNDIAPKDRDIAMVFQNYALYPHMTVYDNMAFGLKLRKTPKDEIKRREAEAKAAKAKRTGIILAFVAVLCVAAFFVVTKIVLPKMNYDNAVKTIIAYIESLDNGREDIWPLFLPKWHKANSVI